MEQLHPRDPYRIGPYRLLSRLGAGGTGQAYLARADRGRTVAVKLVHHDLAAREEFRVRFRQEVAAARRVTGAWTAPVLDADTEAEIPWFATGYVAGPRQRQAVARDFGPLPARSVRILAAGLAYALRDIHRAGLVHGDLKPSGGLLHPDGPRVIDFGIARAAAGPDPAPVRPGELAGPPGAAASEQARGEPVTAAYDVFRLGEVLAYAATGRLPFGDGAGNGDEGRPGGPAALPLRSTGAEPDLAGVPDGLRELVRDCLHTDPAARPEPAEVLARVGVSGAVTGGRTPEPWLPAVLTAQLGRQAAQLPDREDEVPDRLPPEARVPPAPPVAQAPPLPLTPPAPRTAPPAAFAPTAAVPPAERADRTRTASTVSLLAVAVVVAVAAGGSVYAVMNGSWQLTLAPGAAGDRVMTLSVRDPAYACTGKAPLRSAPDPVELEPSTVTSGNPPTCGPGSWSRLRLLPAGTLRREPAGAPGAALTFRKQ
ncbi:serine/threonine-protein kinase [Streptomyces sp. NPDC058646]|uniref:serine/threonine-protein kinase n=1 Tax=Streptomyces sp. NPDC058646 TaxID=3346574 RepID=UPI00364F0128